MQQVRTRTPDTNKKSTTNNVSMPYLGSAGWQRATIYSTVVAVEDVESCRTELSASSACGKYPKQATQSG